MEKTFTGSHIAMHALALIENNIVYMQWSV